MVERGQLERLQEKDMLVLAEGFQCDVRPIEGERSLGRRQCSTQKRVSATCYLVRY